MPTPGLPESSSTPTGHATEAALKAAIVPEITAMLRFAWSRGIELAPEVQERLDSLADSVDGAQQRTGAQAPLALLAELHANLARAVAPALPITLRVMDAHLVDDGWFAIMGPIGNVRRLLTAALAFLVLFVCISLSSTLNTNTMAGDIYTLHGVEQIVAMGFLLSAAGIGGTFQALFTAQRYVAAATYDPRYDGSYWILIALGLVAGLLLAVLIPVSMEGTDSPTLAKPVLALLGGFSSGLVYRTLQRLVDTIDSLIQSRSPSK